MNSLYQQVEDYLSVRRALGFKLVAHGNLLVDFVDQLDQTGTSALTIEAALAWATKPQGVQPYRWKQRLTVIRGFAIYLNALDPATEVPPADLLAYRRQRPTPYLFSDADIAALLAAAGDLGNAPRAATYRTLFGLIAATGMRCGEALALDRDDVDLDTGVLTIRLTKFNKSRRVPLHRSTLAAVRGHLDERDRLYPRPVQPSLFVSTTGTRLADRRVRAVFADLVDQSGLKPRFGSGRPTIHSLRHSFAVATLLDWYRDGADVASRMPLLSAYLGHVSPASTYWYLQATPELLSLAAQRLEAPVGVCS
ncbi:MAG: tyrosine-type recombinase/integrase [Candidatus Microthrix subdominans]|jgi:integrase/recombinase XerD|uniref:Tyrosine-type recombinase/integrase n=1 Tax=Candidatus Neomicrothrix subdominans TaxID=2954438 RepID=A0A936TCJ0_9ACTN|nr:tyrosine-type recombinase/integrase [Candidatus Microthrix subdominans]MBP7406780.1 tyrosine-type recombinase/integrase [Candidatus Microthrix sp.]HBX10521.1 integrase [Candidatus Microthrix parvicella]